MALAKQKTKDILQKTYKDGRSLLPLSIIRNPKIKPHLKAIYLDLLSYAWFDANCYPGYDSLGRDLGLKRGAVYKGIRKLKEMGLISSKRRGLKITNLYTFHELPDNLKISDVRISNNQDVYTSAHKVDEVKVDKDNVIMGSPCDARQTRDLQEIFLKAKPIMEIYFRKYYENLGREHPRIKRNQLIRCAKEIVGFFFFDKDFHWEDDRYPLN